MIEHEILKRPSRNIYLQVKRENADSCRCRNAFTLYGHTVFIPPGSESDLF